MANETADLSSYLIDDKFFLNVCGYAVFSVARLKVVRCEAQKFEIQISATKILFLKSETVGKISDLTFHRLTYAFHLNEFFLSTILG